MNTEKVPEIDQDGKMINPHNPDFITKVPWYLGNNTGPTLKHHNIQKVNHFLSLNEAEEIISRKNLVKKQLTQESGRTTYRKGACKNCGAMTHKEKDCVERPRSSKRAAWKTGLDIAPDEVTLDLSDHGKISYSAKRDQWKGYDPESFQTEIIEKHEMVEAERRKLKREEREQQKLMMQERRRQKKEEKEKKLREKAERKKKMASGGKGKNDFTAGDEKEEGKTHAAGLAEGAGSGSDSGSDSDSDSDYGSDEEDEEDDDDEEGEDGVGGGGGRRDAKDFIAKDEETADFQGAIIPQGGVGGHGMRVTVRNLRLREDTPKYLRNLALDSAFYDPKSRSMRLNPLPDENPEDLAFAGDNFVRHSGDALKLAATQVLCWDMQARGETIDAISNPSQAEFLQKQFVEKKKTLEESKKKAILAKYLDETDLDSHQQEDGNGSNDSQMDAGRAAREAERKLLSDPRLRLGQTEVYREYNKDGRLIKGAPKVVRRTKYEEDVYTNNHTSVWGSYYNRSRASWGFACCHSLLKNSYCTGEKGKEANDRANSQAVDSFQARKMLDSVNKSATSAATGDGKSAGTEGKVTARSDIFGESLHAGDVSDSLLDKKRLQEAIRRAEMEDAAAAGAGGGGGAGLSEEGGEKKRGFNSMRSVEVTKEDMEVYRMKRVKADDPMAAIIGSEELLEYK